MTGRTVVLILEDDEATAEVLRDLIEFQFNDRIITLTAPTVVRAKELYRTHHNRIRVILADHRLKSSSEAGISFVRWLHSEHYTGALVAFSGSDEANAEMIGAGCTDILAKPMRPEIFLELLWRTAKPL